MALLSEAKRKEYFKFLGLGEYGKNNVKKFQKTAFPNHPKEWDGVYGTKTDYALRHWRNVRKFTKNFHPEEFRCNCGHCTGYPSWMKKVELQNLQTIRSHYGKPMKITSGLRCKWDNDHSKGSIKNSKHLTGYACDFYIAGVTDTLAGRKKAIKYIKTLPNHNYTYGNGYNSNGVAIRAAYMGNALHTDTNKPVVKTVKPTVPLAATVAPVASSTAAQKIVANAAAYCWPYGTAKKKYRYSGGSAKSAYKKALKKHMGKEAKISRSDCGYFVNTCVRAAGLGKFKALPGKSSQKYPKLPSTLHIVHKGKIPSGLLQPGDIIRYRKKSGQHTLMYFGDGKIAEANRKNCFPHISKDTKKYNADKVKKSTIQVIRAK